MNLTLSLDMKNQNLLENVTLEMGDMKDQTCQPVYVRVYLNARDTLNSLDKICNNISLIIRCINVSPTFHQDKKSV